MTPAASDAFDVWIHIKEVCPQGGDFTADEQCHAMVARDGVAMGCSVVRATPQTYNADTFQLVQRSGDVMVGRLVDTGLWDEPVTWRRAAPAQVS